MADTDPEQERLAELISLLNSHPPEIVRRAILDAGVVDSALSVLADTARHADDPELREQARRHIEERGLGLLLAEDDGELD